MTKYELLPHHAVVDLEQFLGLQVELLQMRPAFLHEVNHAFYIERLLVFEALQDVLAEFLAEVLLVELSRPRLSSFIVEALELLHLFSLHFLNESLLAPLQELSHLLISAGDGPWAHIFRELVVQSVLIPRDMRKLARICLQKPLVFLDDGEVGLAFLVEEVLLLESNVFMDDFQASLQSLELFPQTVFVSFAFVFQQLLRRFIVFV